MKISLEITYEDLEFLVYLTSSVSQINILSCDRAGKERLSKLIELRILLLNKYNKKSLSFDNRKSFKLSLKFYIATELLRLLEFRQSSFKESLMYQNSCQKLINQLDQQTL